MSAVAIYRYLGPSALTPRGGLALRTSGGAAAHPRLFRGFLTAPEPAALGLLAVAEMARTRYFQPQSAASRDPVVTGGRDRLRVESFSGCGGVHARLDVLPAGLDGEAVHHGTTNVDVNPPLRDALARVHGHDVLRLDVGAESTATTTSMMERRAPLPERWLRGFAEVAATAAGFEPRVEVGAADAAAFLRALPAGEDAAVLWVVPVGRTLRLVSRPGPGAVCLPGPGRLGALRPLLRFATALRVYGPAVDPTTTAAASAWELEMPTQRLTLTLSPEPRLGFSGESEVLDALSGDDVSDDADLVSALLAYDPRIDVDALASGSGLPAGRVRAALARLGAAGRVGYDVTEAAWFHRALPYDAAAVERLDPRLAGARRLVASGAVTLGAGSAWVTSDGERHLVHLAPASCTCPWWVRHRGDRGPCRHALAAAMALAPEPAAADA